jgi:excisionase family DNA binding protein
MSQMEKLLYGVPEAAELTGIGRSKLYEELAAGRIRSVKIGSRRLIPKEALTEFVEGLEDESCEW